MSVLFANTRGSQTSSKNLLEFKAGRIDIQNGSEPAKRKAVPLNAKGLIYITVLSDNLLHFCWKNRESNKNEQDFIIFPGDAEFLRMKECADGRVYMLKFKSADNRHLYWIQESNASKDDELCKKVNVLLNNPPAARPTRQTANLERGTMMNNFNNIFGGSTDMSAFSSMDQNQIMQFLMGNANAGGLTAPAQIPQVTFQPSTTKSGSNTVSASIPSAGSGQHSASDKNNAAQSETTQSASATAQGNVITPDMLAAVLAAAADSGSQGTRPIDLSTVLTRSNVQEIVTKNAERLESLLPDQSPIIEQGVELKSTVGNPQFQQASDFFGQALQTGQLAQVLDQFGLNSNVINAAKNGDLLKFAEQLASQENPKNVSKETNVHADEEETVDSSLKKAESKKKDESKSNDAFNKRPKDEDMDLD